MRIVPPANISFCLKVSINLMVVDDHVHPVIIIALYYCYSVITAVIFSGSLRRPYIKEMKRGYAYIV